MRIVAVVLQAPRCIALSCVPTTDDYAIYVFILMRGPPLPPPERPPLGVFGAALKLRNPTPGQTLHSDKP